MKRTTFEKSNILLRGPAVFPALFVAAVAAVLYCLVPLRYSCAQPSSGSLESDVKAAYILNVTKFVDWKTVNGAPDDPIKIGIVGSDPIGEVLSRLPYYKIAEHPLVVEKIDFEKISAANCHLLFIGKSEKDGFSEILKRLQGVSVLTVSDIPEFASKGGMVGFAIDDGRVKIEINVEKAKKAGLKIGAKLLEVARIVQ